MQINLKFIDGSIEQCNIEATETVHDLKNRLQNEFGLEPQQFNFLYKAKPLRDNVVVSTLFAENEQTPTLVVVMSLRGGAY